MSFARKLNYIINFTDSKIIKQGILQLSPT